MARNQRLKELYEKVDNVKPLAEKDGKRVVTFEDAAIINSYEADEPRIGTQTRNPDGSLASTGKTVHAVNPNYFFLNRYKVKGKKLHLVSGHTPAGYRCIREQASGRVFLKSIPVYIIVRNGDGKLEVEKATTVSDAEFISEFTNTLNNASMAEVLPLIAKYGSDVTADEMPI